MAQRQYGACVCGRSLGQHTRRAARRHHDEWSEAVFTATAIAVVSGIGRAVFELMHGGQDGRGFAGELQSAIYDAAHYVASETPEP